MSLWKEIAPYIDGNGLVAPYLCGGLIKRASDNGPMYTSEYYIMLRQHGESNVYDDAFYVNRLLMCKGDDQELHRAPGDTTPDEVDDYLGALSAHNQLHLHFVFKFPFRLWRQPQLLHAYLINKRNPFAFLLSWYSALVLATACIGTPAGEADPRRLTWHLWNATRRYSFLCNLAGKFWHWRQKRVYKTDKVMQAVAKIYYQDNHPFQRYWQD